MQKTHTVILPTCRKKFKFLWWLCHYIISDILGWPNSETGTYVLQSRTTIKNELGVRFLMANLLDNCFYPFLTRKSFDLKVCCLNILIQEMAPMFVRETAKSVRIQSKESSPSWKVSLILKSLASFATGTVDKEFLFCFKNEDFKDEPISNWESSWSDLIRTGLFLLCYL